MLRDRRLLRCWRDVGAKSLCVVDSSASKGRADRSESTIFLGLAILWPLRTGRGGEGQVHSRHGGCWLQDEKWYPKNARVVATVGQVENDLCDTM